MGDVLIRPAVDTDTAGLALLRTIWAQEDDGVVDDPVFEAEFATWVNRALGERCTWVAEHEGRLIGMMNMALFERMPRPGRSKSLWGYLANAFVLKDFRNAGIGRMLIEHVLAYARQVGLDRIVVHPSDRAIAFYERAGFGPAEMLMVQEF